MRVAVVGAGYAGLACAADLARAAVDVTVYEARDRVGGRVWSDVMPDGARFERGGEFIEPGYDDLRRRAAEHGLPLTGQGFEFAAREVRHDGQILPALLLEAGALLATTVAGPGAAADTISAAAAIERAALGPLARKALSRRLEGTYAVELDRVSAAWLGSAVLRTGQAGTSSRPPVSPPATRRSPGRSQRSWATACGCAARCARCTTRTGREHRGRRPRERFDRAVLAVPLPLALTLVPALRERPSYPRLVFGVASKLHLPLAEPAAAAAVQGLEAAFWTWTASGAAGGPATFASSFAGGASAHAALEFALGSDTGSPPCSAPTRARPGGDAVLTRWSDEPLSGGSYACHPPGWSRRDDEEVAAPYGRVHLAGEHTAAEFCGTFEGALRSGARAAAELSRSASA